jgi:hypothetical protein
MQARSTGMWWGISIESPDLAALGSFYSRLLEGPIVHEEPGTTIVSAPEGLIYLVFQEASGYRPPVSTDKWCTAPDDAL